MDRFLAMTVFSRVVESGSFARAAERLGISTSAASRHVADLEAHLGARLLHRTTRRLSLTEDGRAFHDRCVQLLADLADAESSIAAATIVPRGTLRVTCGLSFGITHLAPAIAEFARLHPAVAFDIDLSDRIVDLVEEGFDLGVRIGPVGSGTLVARPIGATTIVACASPDYVRQHGAPAHPDDLAAHNCLAYAYSSTQGVWQFTDRSGRAWSVRTRGSLEANNGNLIAEVAALGMGIVLEPDFIVAAALAQGRLVRILPDFEGPRLPIQAVYASRRHPSAKVRAFVEFLVSWFAPGAEGATVRLPPPVAGGATPAAAPV